MSAPTSRHRTIRELILLQLSEGKPVTAGGVARRWGEDRFRCQEWLDRFAKQGIVRVVSRQRPGSRRRRRPAESPPLYAPRPRAVMAALAEGR